MKRKLVNIFLKLKFKNKLYFKKIFQTMKKIIQLTKKMSHWN